jgi:hypothetical protein
MGDNTPQTLLPPDRIAELLTETGLTLTARLVEESRDGATRSFATLLARKPELP